MPTHDYIIANGTGAAVRADINLALSAIVSLNSSASEPGTMYAYQLWADTAAGLLKIRNGANSAWITLRQLDGDFSIVAVEDGLQATPSLTFTNDLNTGVFRSGTDALAIVTGGQYAITCTSTQAVGIRTPNPSTALHVAGNARVGADDVTDAVLEIGVGATGNRAAYIDIVADTTYTDYGLRIIRNNTGANATSELKHRGTGALNFTTQEAAPIVFNTTNSPALTILAGGNVGIGTSSPSAKLDVEATNFVGAPAIGVRYNASNVRLGFNIANSNGYTYIGSNTNNKLSSDTATYDLTGHFASQLRLDVGQLVFNNAPIGTAGDDITFTNRLTITSGGLVGIGTNASNANGGILQLSGGITFPATPVATTDVNTLDDYEEGTWAATITPQTSGTITLSADTGHYVKIGKQVVVTSKLAVSAVSTPLGFVKISLPFNSGANAQGSFSAIMENTVSTGAANFWSIVPASSNSLEVYLAAANNPSATSAAQFQAGSTVWLTATYFV